jgi:hypothetical protein
VVAEHCDAIAQKAELNQLRRQEQDRDAARGESDQDIVKLPLRPQVNAAHGVVQNQDTRFGGDEPRKQRLLLIGERQSAREFLDVEAAHAHDCERFAYELGFSRRVCFAQNDSVKAEHHVVADRHLWKDQGLLEDGGDSRCLRCAREEIWNGSPFHSSVPDSALTIPLRILMSVLLPEPFSPTTA